MDSLEMHGESGEHVVEKTSTTAAYVKPKVEKLQKLAEVTGVAKMTGLPEEE